MVPVAVVVGSTLIFTGLGSSGMDVQKWLIVPGSRVGKIHLGTEMTKVFATIGHPRKVVGMEGDAAMGHFWTRWPGSSGHELDIYSVRGEDDSASTPEVIVHEIRVTSPSFLTATNIHVGTSLSMVRNLSYPLSLIKSKPDLRIYDNPKSGIGFEFKPTRSKWVCTAIVVHDKGSNVLQQYLPYPGSS